MRHDKKFGLRTEFIHKRGSGRKEKASLLPGPHSLGRSGFDFSLLLKTPPLHATMLLLPPFTLTRTWFPLAGFLFDVSQY